MNLLREYIRELLTESVDPKMMELIDRLEEKGWKIKLRQDRAILFDPVAVKVHGTIGWMTPEEYEYENMMMTSQRGRSGQVMDGGFGSGTSHRGVRTTQAVKKIGCSLLKGMIEEDKLLINDFDTIQELVSFVSKKSSFAADEGHNDDLVMTLVLFAWMTSQAYFKEFSDIDIRKTLYEEQIKRMEEDLTPFGIINTGLERDTFRDDEGNTWTVV